MDGTAAAPSVSAVIPAHNEADRIVQTLAAVGIGLSDAGIGGDAELIVVDDGSGDDTAARAEAVTGVRVIRLGQNQGKGAALTRGLNTSTGRVLLILDADLGASAAECARLLAPVRAGEADMTIARFPPGPGAGFGLVLRFARWGVLRLTGRRLEAPLSGQRAFTRALWERIGRIAPGYGAEVGLDIDVLRAGFRIVEVPTAMGHRALGRGWNGFRHRGRQCVAIAATLAARWHR